VKTNSNTLPNEEGDNLNSSSEKQKCSCNSSSIYELSSIKGRNRLDNEFILKKLNIYLVVRRICDYEGKNG
jgi:hypothetical protein